MEPLDICRVRHCVFMSKPLRYPMEQWWPSSQWASFGATDHGGVHMQSLCAVFSEAPQYWSPTMQHSKQCQKHLRVAVCLIMKFIWDCCAHKHLLLFPIFNSHIQLYYPHEEVISHSLHSFTPHPIQVLWQSSTPLGVIWWNENTWKI